MKRAIDLVLGWVLLVVAAPFIALASLAIRIETPGAPLFVHERAGMAGRPFRIYKLRTMRTGVDPYQNSPQRGHDPRITRVGRFLRRTSIDELPQLINVVRGDMSLVGPRPAFLHQAARYDERERGRLAVRPGITGLAQVAGRSALTWDERLDLDLEYVRRAGVRADLAILARTPFALLSGLSTEEPEDVEPPRWRK